MPTGKNKKRNAFYYFMQARKPEVERKLKREVTMDEMPQHVSSDWQALPEHEKNKYKVMCGQPRREKMDCRGVPLSQLQKESEDQNRQADTMKREIADIVDIYHQGGALHQTTFYILSTNFYVHTDLDSFVPAELSIIQFSFKSGIIREFHETVWPTIPLCYRATAKKHSEDTHNLMFELDKNPGLTLDQVNQNLKKFLSKDWEERMPFYTLHNEINQSKHILDIITDKEYKVYSLDILYQFIYSTVVSSIPQCIAHDIITDCGLDFYPNLSCIWHITHQKDSARFCTLSTVRRWFYFMCKHIDLEKNFRVVLKPGKHYPNQGNQDQDVMERRFSNLDLESGFTGGATAASEPWTVKHSRDKRFTKSNTENISHEKPHIPKNKRGPDDDENVWSWPTVEHK